MAWNEPGGSGNKDPWGNRNQNQGPPDLDEIFKKLNDKLSGLFGKRRSSGSTGSGDGAGFPIGLIAGIVLVIWGLFGIYIVDEGKQGVVLQFGEFNKITNPGPHWYPPMIQSVVLVDKENVRNVDIGLRSDEALMLTQDENIVDIKFTVQYRIKSAENFVFNVRDPDNTLRQAGESAMREVVGKNTMDFIITEGRAPVASAAQKLAQEILDGYKSGLVITQLNLQDAKAPQQVQHAFDDAVKAREDQSRLVNEAEAYSNDILPKARGRAARVEEEANAYRDQVVAEAEGDAERFIKVLREYQKAPDVTRDRLYLETMEAVLGNANKVMVDVKQGNSLIYLPLDRIANQGAGRAPQMDSDAAPAATGNSDTSRAIDDLNSRVRDMRDRLRSREVR